MLTSADKLSRIPATAMQAFMADAFLLSAARIPIGKYLGGLAEVPAVQLGAVAGAEALRRAKVAPTEKLFAPTCHFDS